MLEKKNMKIFLSLLSLILLLPSCRSIQIKDSEHCTVAGTVSAGANCTKLLSGNERELTFEEFIDMLEPNNERGGAVITPLNDFVSIKENLETACVLLKDRCTQEVKKNLELMSKNLSTILNQ